MLTVVVVHQEHLEQHHLVVQLTEVQETEHLEAVVTEALLPLQEVEAIALAEAVAAQEAVIALDEAVVEVQEAVTEVQEVAQEVLVALDLQEEEGVETK